jgi:hypothetical protein
VNWIELAQDGVGWQACEHSGGPLVCITVFLDHLNTHQLPEIDPVLCS